MKEMLSTNPRKLVSYLFIYFICCSYTSVEVSSKCTKVQLFTYNSHHMTLSPPGIFLGNHLGITDL